MSKRRFTSCQYTVFLLLPSELSLHTPVLVLVTHFLFFDAGVVFPAAILLQELCACVCIFLVGVLVS
jgi:hypothetical protein